MGAYKTLAWERLSGQALYNEVRRFVTIHKFEPDDDALRTAEGNEGIQDVTLLSHLDDPVFLEQYRDLEFENAWGNIHPK